jgi:hypothetical protein
VALFLLWLVSFDLDPVGVRVGVLPDAGYLAGDFHIQLVGANDKAILVHLFGDDGLGRTGPLPSVDSGNHDLVL